MASTSIPERQDVWIPSRDGKAELSAWFYPSPSGAKGPCVVIGHGVSGAKALGLDPFGRVFQKAGYSALAFDYGGFGDSKGTVTRQVIDFYQQQVDWKAAVKFAREHELVDPEKVIIFGTSFGGGHVIQLASLDHGIAAAISQCPFTSGRNSAKTLGLLPTLKLVSLVLRDYVGSFYSKEIVSIPLAGHPGDVALMNAHDAMSGHGALRPERSDLPDYVAARVGLQIPRLEPGARARYIECPFHVAICLLDTVAPAKATLSYVQQAPKAEIERYNCGHFDVYSGEFFDKATANYVKFLQHHVPPVQAKM